MAVVKWEYMVFPVAGETAAGDEANLEEQLDELGGEGWELVAIDPSAESSMYVFKRRVQSSPDEDEEGYEDGDEDYDDDEYDADGTIRI